MANRKCFEGPSDKINSGDYISRKKAKAIYKASVDLANQPIPGVYKKKTIVGGIGNKNKKKGKSNGIYVGDVYIGSDHCLIGSRNYDTLLSVTKGKYLSAPISFDLRREQSIWTGSLYEMDLSGTETILREPSRPHSITNTFKYPPSSYLNDEYPTDTSNNNIGLVVDPNFDIFYPKITQDNRSRCYLKNETSWKQHLKCLPFNKTQAQIYYQTQNGFIGDFNYPNKFHFDCSNNWINDISQCLLLPK